MAAENHSRVDSNLKPSELMAAFKRSEDIDALLDEERELKGKEVLILILGSACSGKTTFLKQLRILYDGGFSDMERREFKPIIFENVKRATTVILEGMRDVDLSLEGREFDDLHEEMLLKDVDNNDINELCFEDKVPLLTRFWNNPAVQACFEKRNLFFLDDSVKYFFENIERITKPHYLPTHDDILQVRQQTQGIQERRIMVNSFTYRVIDVGGQKSQRKKWIHFFEGVTAVIFFVSLSSYDEFVEEDDSQNAMLDSLELFQEISSNRFLEDAEFILFLNKHDLFLQKLQTTSLASCFPDYKGGSDPARALDYIRDVFLSRKPAHKNVYVHVTCATETDMMKPVLTDVFEVLVDVNLKKLSTL